MTQFKVCDWVRNKHITHLISKVQTINKFGEIILENGYLHKITDDCLELWQPKEGEWCLFIMNADESSLRQWTNSHIDNNQLKAGMCEPFIGQLPRFLKDK